MDKLKINKHHVWNNRAGDTIAVTRIEHELIHSGQGRVVRDMIHQEHPDYKIPKGGFGSDPLTLDKINPKGWGASL